MLRRGRFMFLLLAVVGCAPSAAEQVRDLNANGVALLSRHDYATAREQFHRAVELAPEDATSRYNLASAAHHAGDWAGAENQYRACLGQSPEHASCRHGLALLLLQQNRPEEAWELIESWASQRPQSADAQAEYGWLLREGGDLPAAQAQLQHALALDPNNVRALFEMGIIYETHSYPERARSLYQRALQREPHQMEVIARLARLSRQRPKS